MSISKNFYLAMALLGTVIPWFFFGSFFAGAGFDVPLFVQSVIGNKPAAGFTAVVLWVWSYTDARQKGVRYWWVVLPATCLVGVSLSLPLYLYLRADT